MTRKIEIPNEFMGVPVNEKTLKETLASAGTQQRRQTTPNINAPSLDGFEYVPSLGLYVEKEKELHSKTWNEAREELHQRGDRKPTISEYVAFINHLRAKNDAEARQILDEIYAVRIPGRGEFLDAKFSVSGGVVTMKYHIFTDSGIEQRQVNLQGILKYDKLGIDLDRWLSDNEHGLPKDNVPDGQLYFWYPRNGAVAGFDADSGRANLYCDGDPDDRSDSLGVRAVRRAGAQN